MKIFVPVHWYLPHHSGGAENMLHSMLVPLAQRGHEITVSESRAPRNEAYWHTGYEVDGIKVLPMVDYRDDMPERMYGNDVVVTHLENTSRAIILARWAKLPTFVLNHNDMSNTRAWACEQDVVQVYNSEWLKAALPEVPMSLICRPPVNAQRYRTTPGDHVTQVNLSGDKGAHIFYHLAERMPDVKFLGVLGAHGEQIVRDLPNVTILDHQKPEQMKAVYGRTRVLLMPSDYESWGMVGVEALSSGIPVMASPTPGLLESQGSAGTFIDRNDLLGWEGKLRFLLDGRHWRAASRRAKERSAELERIREEDISRWIEAVEGA